MAAGISDIHRFLAALEVEGGHDRVIEVAANGCPALAVYRPAGPSGALEPFEIHVLEITGGRIAAIHAFLDPALFPVFGLPPTRRASSRGSIWESNDHLEVGIPLWPLGLSGGK